MIFGDIMYNVIERIFDFFIYQIPTYKYQFGWFKMKMPGLRVEPSKEDILSLSHQLRELKRIEKFCRYRGYDGITMAHDIRNLIEAMRRTKVPIKNFGDIKRELLCYIHSDAFCVVYTENIVSHKNDINGEFHNVLRFLPKEKQYMKKKHSVLVGRVEGYNDKVLQELFDYEKIIDDNKLTSIRNIKNMNKMYKCNFFRVRHYI